MMRVMALRGYDGAALSEIAREAGLNQGLIHYHFKNKAAILLSILNRLADEHDAELGHQLAQAGGDPLAQLDAFIECHLKSGGTANPERLACWIVITSEALRTPRVRGLYEDAVEGTVLLLSTVIGRGIDQGVFRADDVTAAATAIVATIQGYFVLAAVTRGLIPSGSAAEATRQMARGLLGV